MKKIVCIGAGASGIIAALHLVEQDFNAQIILLGEAPGPAYSTPEPYHILNVTARNMSAFASDPLHFHRFAEGCLGHPDLSHEAFVARKVFREYLEMLLEELQQRGVQYIKDQAIALSCTHPGYRIETTVSGSIEADGVVLAMGNFPAASLPGGETLAPEQYIAVPWNKNIAEGLDPAAEVLFVGTGLTMIDGVTTLAHYGHKGSVMALSRHGLLPLARTIVDPLPMSMEELSADSVTRLMHKLRQMAQDQMQRGEPWDRVIDGIRPFLQSLWTGFNRVEQKRFLRHASVYWDIHRHRIPQESADVLASLLASAQLHVMAARLIELNQKGSRVEVSLRRRGQNAIEHISVDCVINCTGPVADYHRVDSPLLRSLFASGLARPHPLKLGFDATPEGKLYNADGIAQDTLRTLGPPLKGVLWESVAVPEIRAEAATLAKALEATFREQPELSVKTR